jgi:hypothetical protein
MVTLVVTVPEESELDEAEVVPVGLAPDAASLKASA